MGPRVKSGSVKLGEAIRKRRADLGLSIEESASLAGVGVKTWSRYESGGAIRQDKVRGVCKALSWTALPLAGESDTDEWISEIQEGNPAWSKNLEELYGRACAATFAAGSEMTIDQLSEDLEQLGRLPVNSHLGQLDVSWFGDELPAQFLTKYDYEFVYKLRATVKDLQVRFVHGHPLAYTVLEEVALYLIFSFGDMFSDLSPEFFREEDDWNEWLGSILTDLDVSFYLFSGNAFVSGSNEFHFSHWDKKIYWQPVNEVAEEPGRE